MLFYRLLQQSVNTDPHPLADLIGGTAASPHAELQRQLINCASNTFGEFYKLVHLSR